MYDVVVIIFTFSVRGCRQACDKVDVVSVLFIALIPLFVPHTRLHVAVMVTMALIVTVRVTHHYTCLLCTVNFLYSMSAI